MVLMLLPCSCRVSQLSQPQLGSFALKLTCQCLFRKRLDQSKSPRVRLQRLEKCLDQKDQISLVVVDMATLFVQLCTHLLCAVDECTLDLVKIIVLCKCENALCAKKQLHGTVHIDSLLQNFSSPTEVPVTAFHLALVTSTLLDLLSNSTSQEVVLFVLSEVEFKYDR